MVKAVVFDLRDTLVRVDKAYQAANAYLLRFLGEHERFLTPEQFNQAFRRAMDEVRGREGNNSRVHNWTALFVRQFFNNLRLDLSDREVEVFLENYDRQFINNVSMYEDAEEIINYLRSKNIRMALVIDGTSKRERAILGRLELAGMVHTIIISEEVGRNKFTSIPLEAALQRLNEPVSDVWVIGDRLDKDIIHANKLGCISVKLERTGGRYMLQKHTSSRDRPMYVIKSLEELMGLIS